MIVNVIKGNLIEEFKNYKYKAIIQGCNCFNTMGSGIAISLRKEFSGVYQADTDFCKDVTNPVDRLGTYSYCYTKYGIIINLYTQFKYGTDKRHVSYDAIADGFEKLNSIKLFHNKERLIGIPKIGAGLGGGNWNIIYKIIDEVTPNLNIEVVEFE